MKNHFKRRFLGTMLLLAGATTLTSCIFSSDEDLTQWESTGLSDALPKAAASSNSYSDDLFSLSHSIEGNWKFNCYYELNQNGGFIITPLGSETSGEILAYTKIQGSEKFDGQKTLLFSIEGGGQTVILSVIDSNGKERQVEANITSEEKLYEVFLGGLDLTGQFKVAIKAGSNCSNEILFRDIHFTSYLPESYPTPYTDNNGNELFLTRDFKKHWELNLETDKKYDDIIRVSSKVDDPTDKFIKTTVIGSESLKRFKTFCFTISSFKFEGAYNCKVRIGNEERDYAITSQYSTTTLGRISLENIDVTKDFDIYIYPKTGNTQVATNLKVETIYLTSYENTSVNVPLCDEVDITANASYHWNIGDNVNEKISYDNNKVSTETFSDSPQNVRLYTAISNVVSNDFRYAKAIVKGVAGNQIKYSFMRGEISYSADTDQLATLTGEEQELIFSFDYKYSPYGICFYPNLEGNTPGTFEIISVVYETDDSEILKLSEHTDLVGQDEIDITALAKDHWIYEGDTITVNDDGTVTADYTTSVDNPVSLVIKRAPEYESYYGAKIICKADGTLNSAYSQNSQNSYGMHEFTGYKEAMIHTLSNANFKDSNLYFSFSKWPNAGEDGNCTLTIYKVILFKKYPDITYTPNYSDMLRKNNFRSIWPCTAHQTRVENDGVVFTVEANSEPTLSKQSLKCNESASFSKVSLEFDAPSANINLAAYVQLYNSETVTITPSMTSCDINITKKGTNSWSNYSYYSFGIITSSTSNQDVNLKIKSISLIKVS